MTEAEWLDCNDPKPMLAFLDGQASQRNLRLFAVACCRHIWPLLDDEAFRRAVELSERFAEGQLSKEDLNAAGQAARVVARRTIGDWCGPYDGDLDEPDLETISNWHPAVATAVAVPGAKSTRRFVWVAHYAASLVGPQEWTHQARILRCVFGNPFRGASIDPGWLTPTVQTLARAAYEERSLPSGELDMVRLAVLADAVEEAGCTDRDILDHLRGAGPHVRGCWVIDLLTARH
jgi:hypothetical protein